MDLNFHTSGTGDPVLLLHGLLGSHQNLLPIAMRLSSHFTVFALDQRNHGASPHHAAMNYDLLAADVADFIQAKQLGPVHVLGHSMGGKTAMRLAQLHPELVRGLIVVDMSPRAQPPRYAGLLDALNALDPARFANRTDVEAALIPAVPDKTIRQFLLKNLGRDAGGQLVWKANIRALRHNYGELRQAIPLDRSFVGPTLVVRGGRSDFVLAEDQHLFEQIFPRAQMETIDAAGHWVHAEAFEPFMAAITKFLLP